MIELKAFEVGLGRYCKDGSPCVVAFATGRTPRALNEKIYLKSEADKVITKKDADYKEACDRLKTSNLIKDEQKAKADKLLSCLKCLVTRDLIKDCPEKVSAIEIVKEYDKCC